MPIDDIIQKLSPSAKPFERINFQKKVATGHEDILFPSIRLFSSVLPSTIKLFSEKEIFDFFTKKSIIGKYLWIIDEENGLRIIEENTPNIPAEANERIKKVVCHTILQEVKMRYKAEKCGFVAMGHFILITCQVDMGRVQFYIKKA